MNKLINFAVLGLVLACGATPEEVEEFELELAQSEQGLSAKTSPTFQYGTSTSTSKAACNKTSTGQVCSVPTSRQVNFCLFDNLSAAHKTRIRNIAITLNNLSNNFNFTEMDLVHPSCIPTVLGEPTPNLVFSNQACSGGTASDNIEAYSCGNFTAENANLSEASGVVGNYQSHNRFGALLDIDIWVLGFKLII